MGKKQNKERIQRNRHMQKVAKSRKKLIEILHATPTGEQPSMDGLATGHLRRIVDNPPDLSRFSNATTIHSLASTILTERLLKLEREK